MLNEPFKCTAITSDQSEWLILWKMTSRRMPALLTRMSTRPKASSAALTISSAFFGSVIESVEAIASPPAFLMAATVSCAGPASVPEPVEARADVADHDARAFSAISSAMARPMPRPPPVTMATLPSTIPVIYPLFPALYARPCWREQTPKTLTTIAPACCKRRDSRPEGCVNHAALRRQP